MIHKQPLAHSAYRPRPVNTAIYQWRGWGDDIKEALPKVRRHLKLSKDHSCRDTHIVVPGRIDQHIRLSEDNQIEIKSLVETVDDIEHWAVMCKSAFPLSRPTAMAISRRIPRIGASAVMASSSDDMTEKLGRGVKAFKVKKSRKIYRGDGVTARVATLHIDGVKKRSLTLTSESPDKLRALLARTKLRPHRNRNFVDVLSEMKVPA